MSSKYEKLNTFMDWVIGIVAAASFLILLLQWGLQLGDTYREIFNKIDVIVLFVFLFDIIIRFIAAPQKKGYFKNHWMDLIVFIPFIQYVQGIRTARVFVVIRQIIVLFALISRTKRLQKLISLLGLKPAQMLVVSFMMTILIGTFLLMLPISTKSGEGLKLVDAVFTATSATCVTGLIVKDTGSHFSLFGQIIILALIQIGALGIMTFSVTLFMAVGRQISHRETRTMQDVLDQDSISGILDFVKFIVKMTVFIELLGTVFLYVAFEPYIADPLSRFYISLFHSISAFCNAGFSLFSDSLMGFAKDAEINLCIAFLIIFGGLGFIVIKDVWEKYGKHTRPKTIGLKLHTKLVLVMSCLLLILGTIFIYFAEYNHALAGMPLKEKILISFFQSVTARTAGFNSLDIGRMTHASIFTIIVLMFIGASAGSTGGGIKTTTFWVIIRAFTNSLRNKDDIAAFKRKVPDAIVKKALAVFVLSLGLVGLFSYLVAVFEELPFRGILFEVVSAFGTVGLSCGITADMHNAGKILITILMFLGRLGPLTIVLAFSRYTRKINYTFAEEKIMVG